MVASVQSASGLSMLQALKPVLMAADATVETAAGEVAARPGEPVAAPGLDPEKTPQAPHFRPSAYNFRSADEAGTLFLFNTASAHRLVLTPAQSLLFERWSEQPELLTQVLSPETRSRFAAPPTGAPSPASELLADPPSADPLDGLDVSFLAETSGYTPRSDLDGPALRVTDDALPDRLVAEGFFVLRQRSEVQEILQRMKRQRQQQSHLALTLSMTSDCDLACPYCVIRTTEGRGGMPPHVQTALLRWWERQLVGRSTCSFEWMGGEPLLYPETLLSLGEALMARARLAGVTCTQQTLITNGTHLTPELAVRLKAMGIQHVQITLDGPPEVHDACRPTVDGQGSFETILNHVKAARSLFAISIRVNLSQHNAHRYPELLDRLAQEDLLSLAVYPARVYEPESRSECGTFSHCSLTPDRFAKLAIDFELDGMDRGFQRTALPRVAYGGFCGAYHQSYFVVGPDGLLYRCPSRVGQVKSSAIGSVFELAPAPYMTINQDYYDALGPTETKGCFTCKFLPACLGGCPEESKVSGELLDECTPWRFRLKHQLAIEHEWQKARYEEIRV